MSGQRVSVAEEEWKESLGEELRMGGDKDQSFSHSILYLLRTPGASPSKTLANFLSWTQS